MRRPLASVTLLAFALGCSSSSSPLGPTAGADGGVEGVDAEVLPNTDASREGAPSRDATGDAPPDALPSGRSFPDTSATIAILADQLPTMTAAQQHFAATHYAGTQKQLLPETQALRAINP